MDYQCLNLKSVFFLISFESNQYMIDLKDFFSLFDIHTSELHYIYTKKEFYIRIFSHQYTFTNFRLNPQNTGRYLKGL